MPFDHVLLIGFGGPTKTEEIRPFLNVVSHSANIPEARIKDVEHHYKAVGGYSRYNEDTFLLATALDLNLNSIGVNLPIFVGMRNWNPFLKDVIADIWQKGLRNGIGIVLAPHRSYASYDRYILNVEEAKRIASANSLKYKYLPSWHNHPMFIEAQVCIVQQTLESLPQADRAGAHILFSAHSIPVKSAKESGYVEEIEESSRGIAEGVKHNKWSVAYQSRSGSSREPWLWPDVVSAIRGIKEKGARSVVVVPIGFLCENVEVLFDLDIEAKEEANQAGITFLRAPTIRNHPRFVEMVSLLISASL